MFKGLILLAAAGFAASVYSSNRRKRLVHGGSSPSFSSGRSGSSGHGSNPGMGASDLGPSSMGSGLDMPGRSSSSMGRTDDLLSPDSPRSAGSGQAGAAGTSGI